MSLSARQRITLLLMTVTVVGSLFLLGISLSDVRLSSGIASAEDLALSPQDLFPPPPTFTLPPVLWDIMVATIWASLTLTVLFLAVSPEARADARYLARRSLFVLGLILIIALLYQRPPETEVPEATPEGSTITFDSASDVAQLDRPPDAPPVNPDPPSAVTMVLSVAVSIGLALLAYSLWQRRQGRIQAADALGPVSERARKAIEELRQGSRFEEVILLCYKEMSQTAASERGAVRGRGVTPREFEDELRRAGLPESSVDRLTRLFEKVRYGDHAPTARDRLEAVDCLQEIVNACEQLRHSQTRPQLQEGTGPRADDFQDRRRWQP